MIRGTTPTLVFELPFSTDLIAEAFVTLSQNRQVIVDKQLTDCSCEGNKLTVKLTQAETLLLQCDCKTEIQVRCRTTEGEAMASDIIVVSTERILKEGQI